MYKELFSCNNKIAMVTGGAGLIGSEIVKGLYEFDATVYIADTDEQKANELRKGTGIKFIRLDITSQDSIKEGVSTVIKNDKKIDILINCAYPRTKNWGLKFEHIPFDSWKENVNDHLGGYFLCCQIVAETMKQQGGGSIINFASTYGVVAPDFSIYDGTEMTMSAAYSAIKGGIITFTRYLATYYAKYNIRVNSISPGGIFDNQHPSFVGKYSKKAPIGRMARPDEIVGGVIYLASDASSYVTGHNLMIDGGWTAW